MSAEDPTAEADLRQQLHNAATRRVRRIRRVLVGASAWAVAMLLTASRLQGWWGAGATATGVDAATAELTFRTLLTAALLLAVVMLLPQILTWTTTPSGRVSDRAIRRLLEAEARRAGLEQRRDRP
ncbi:hypothetical protein [uncultured Microbacterium sp.]|uniref:hypothetical protein n=1 Tax=uncultured Microbacterium sp. TaxID=191216 RepID=UPI0025CE00B3|nr:hypothetical protein [uncultured Microbacterium sp.]